MGQTTLGLKYTFTSSSITYSYSSQLPARHLLLPLLHNRLVLLNALSTAKSLVHCTIQCTPETLPSALFRLANDHHTE